MASNDFKELHKKGKLMVNLQDRRTIEIMHRVEVVDELIKKYKKEKRELVKELKRLEEYFFGEKGSNRAEYDSFIKNQKELEKAIANNSKI